MKYILRVLNAKPLFPVYLIWSLIAIATFPERTEAMFIFSAPHENAINPAQATGDRAADIATIRAALESKVVRQKLMDLGLSSEEALARIDGLSDKQVHQFASRINSLQAGGHHGNLIIVLLLVIIIILII